MTGTASLPASRDELTGEIYVPPRRFAADGSLRETTPVEVPAKGTLASWTNYHGEFYGLIDLDHDARVQVVLGPGPHEIGAGYHGIEQSDGEVRFFHD